MTNADFLTALNLVVTVALAVWAIYQTILTHRLERELHRLSVELDQSLQRLYRARDALIKFHATLDTYYVWRYYFIAKVAPVNFEAMVESFGTINASLAELEGIIISVGDKKLSALWEDMTRWDLETQARLATATSEQLMQMSSDFGKVITKIHARISQLIIDTTKSNT